MRYFRPEEFACKCGKCGKGFADMNPKLLEMLDEAREKAGIPMVLNSGFRCVEHNRAVGGVKNSSHSRGYAVDIRCNTSQNRYKLLKALIEVGFNRIELCPTWLHVDNDPDKVPCVAFYQPGGKY